MRPKSRIYGIVSISFSSALMYIGILIKSPVENLITISVSSNISSGLGENKI